MFRIIPRFPIFKSELEAQKEPMDITTTAKAEMNTIFAERKIPTALHCNASLTAYRNHKLGEQVLVFNETKKQ